jgi:hypothetical protein
MIGVCRAGARYLRSHAELCFELAGLVSIRSDDETHRVRAERYLAQAAEIEGLTSSRLPSATKGSERNES